MKHPITQRLAVLACMVACSVTSLAHAAGFDAVEGIAAKGFDVSAQAVLLDGNTTLGAIAPRAMLTPASVSKLYISAASLDRFGPQKRFTTRLVTTGEVESNGTLRGDIILDGAGDPGLTSNDYWMLVQGLKQLGVKRVRGNVLVSEWRFGPVPCISTDRCRARTSSRHAYDALLSSAAVDFANWCVRVYPGSKVGEPAHLQGCFGEKALTAVDSSIKTVATTQPTRISGARVTSGSTDTLKLDGTIALDTFPRNIYRASADPAQQSLYTLVDLMHQADITVTGNATLSRTRPPSDATVLASVDGPTLQELLLRMMNYSNNFMADVLALDLSSTTPATLANASAALERFVATVPGHGPVTLQSGSGLTTQNKTSAHGLIALLNEMYHRPALFPVFVAGMQAPVNGPMRFIRRGSDVFQNNIMIKTGTLNQPVPVRAVAGYFRTRQGRWGAFAVMVNGRAATPYLRWKDVLEAVSKDLTPMIENH
ncbi:D-alanyl-D-alanine carboxypeptidase/D-alanyl-D-alanine endopeptidase [Larsenimonas rhizosphaerae]|uniref:D-alanyl-D-alanine carboxypeptidase/D-alanyl-D-alanine endopeptidase n=1 Tax=Larsenimonas rhizosphaerae TaxID=2944682 RepID=UPI0020340AF5|nr:D-alanyl-D-alanine carboxypeptidase/D-alanyl-D-alanine-endopeptidase [Larsenimonas rhizosphaerae]MCM2131724.1 D-alanyl-D-alanine carboxypeptidase/D-alanyl-D-alanine-endopeptidase [Larsenimonas rhizosphaerae]